MVAAEVLFAGASLLGLTPCAGQFSCAGSFVLPWSPLHVRSPLQAFDVMLMFEARRIPCS
jgi:hypothetical protein